MSYFVIVWRSSPDGRLEEAVVPNLGPLIRAAQSGRDGLVQLPDRRKIRPSWLQSVAEYDAEKRPCAAWAVLEHGIDGRHDWQQEWRAVAAAVAAVTRAGGLTAEDPRLSAVLAALDQLERAYAERDVLRWLAARAALDRALAAGREAACTASRK